MSSEAHQHSDGDFKDLARRLQAVAGVLNGADRFPGKSDSQRSRGEVGLDDDRLDLHSLDLSRLEVLVGRAEAAISAGVAHEEALRLSLTDGLTGLWNRRHLDLALKSELARAVRFKDPFSLLFCDIDNFKLINDRYGHPIGDDILIELGRRLVAVTREVDVVSRFGGDEFTLLLPRTDLEGATRLAEKVRLAVAHQPFQAGATHPWVTISIGVGTHPEHGNTARDLVVSADAAMYRAKEQGGDRVELVV